MTKYKVLLGDSIKKIWNNLKDKINKETYTKDEVILYGKIKKVIGYLENDLRPSGFVSKRKEQIDSLTKKFTKQMNSEVELPVHHGYLENNTSGARRIFWAKKPNQNIIVIIGIENHPNKNSEYSNVKLDNFPPDEEKENKSEKTIDTFKLELFKDIENFDKLFYLPRLRNKKFTMFVTINEDNEFYLIFKDKHDKDKFLIIKITIEEVTLLKSNQIGLSDILLNHSNEIYLLDKDNFSKIDFDSAINYSPDNEVYLSDSIKFYKLILDKFTFDL